jgi:hypothetical protein
MAVNAIKPIAETMKAGVTEISSPLADLHSIGQDTAHFGKPAKNEATDFLAKVRTFFAKSFEFLIMKPYRWMGRKLGWLPKEKPQPTVTEPIAPPKPPDPLPGQLPEAKPPEQAIPESSLSPSSAVKPEAVSIEKEPVEKGQVTVQEERQSKSTVSQATQTEAPQKLSPEKPEPKPDWFGFPMRYEDTQGQLSWQLTRLHQRASKMPTLLATKPGELRDLSQQYQMLYMPESRDKELIYELSELGKTGQRSRAEIANTQQAVELRASLQGKRHFMNRTRTILNEFQNYQQQYGQGWRGLIYGLSRQDRQILKEIEQKLNHYDATVQALSQAIHPEHV